MSNKTFTLFKAIVRSVFLSGHEYVLSSNLILKAKYLFALKEYRTTWVNLSRFTFQCLNSMYSRVYSSPCWWCVRLLFSTINASRPVQWTRGKVLYKITIRLMLHSVGIVLSSIYSYHVEWILFMRHQFFFNLSTSAVLGPLLLSAHSLTTTHTLSIDCFFECLSYSAISLRISIFTIRIFYCFNQSFGVGEKLSFIQTNVTVLLVFV